MASRILIVPDKFKGTLTAQAAAVAIATGWGRARATDQLELLPMSDGGDGFGEVLSRLLGAEPQTVRTIDAAHRPIEATWWWQPSGQIAIIESARVVGLAMLPRGKYHPFELDTHGLGAVLRAATEKGARRCWVGVGGSATNDAGFGLARALGWRFVNAHDADITRWTELHRLSCLRAPRDGVRLEEFLVAVDVQNPLLGPDGCSRVYGPQKGLREFDLAERCLARLVSVLQAQRFPTEANTPGAGAAGGLGFGLMTFAGARPESGFRLFERCARLAERVAGSDLVITGEGALDAQTLMGKGVGEVAELCARLGVPCVGLAGVVPDVQAAQTRFRVARGITPDLTDRDHAMCSPGPWLERLAEAVANDASTWLG